MVKVGWKRDGRKRRRVLAVFLCMCLLITQTAIGSVPLVWAAEESPAASDDNTAPVIGTLVYGYQPKNVWQWLMGEESLFILVPVTEEGSGADEISYTVTPDSGSARNKTARLYDGAAVICIAPDFKGTITIACTDKAGNISASVTVGADLSGSGVIIEDNAPEIAFETDGGAVSADAYDAAPEITVTVTDDKENAVSAGIASVIYQITNETEVAVQQDFTASIKTKICFTIPTDRILPGTTVITVKATDNAGNYAEKSLTVTVVSGEGS